MGKKRFLGRVEVLNAQTDKEAVNFGQVKDMINRFVKETVRVATTGELAGTYTNGVLTLDTRLSEIDDVALISGDRILVKDQLDKTQNGIYVVAGTPSSATADISSSTGITEASVDLATFETKILNDSIEPYEAGTNTYAFLYNDAWGVVNKDLMGTETTTSVSLADYGISFTGTANNGDEIIITYVPSTVGLAITRSEDCKEGTVLMNNTTIPVSEGTTNGDTKFVLASDGVLTVGTSSLVFIKDIKIQESAIKVVKGTITGDGVSTAFNVAHNLNLTDPEAYILHIKDNAGNDVEVNNEPTTSNEANSIALTFAVAPLATETFKVFIIGLE